ncbi:hypothetical protein Maes01_02529 [Microbulbifer aestuariivivens]|uniref:Cytochrome c domain-containing protein n=1 Tax=Microbulbifer aestuariivivens TaxID=1908308 RepID=A0ABP9WTY3_9GAMM
MSLFHGALGPASISRAFFFYAAVALLSACSPPEPESSQSETSSVEPASLAETKQLRDINQLYQRTCISCHSNGLNGAPRTGDQSVWAVRMEKGMDTLVENARNGFQAMPPRGLCFDCSDEEYAALIHLMAEESNEGQP